MKCDSWRWVWSSQLFYSELPQYVLETIFGAKMEMFKSVTNITMWLSQWEARQWKLLKLLQEKEQQGRRRRLEEVGWCWRQIVWVRGVETVTVGSWPGVGRAAWEETGRSWATVPVCWEEGGARLIINILLIFSWYKPSHTLHIIQNNISSHPSTLRLVWPPLTKFQWISLFGHPKISNLPKHLHTRFYNKPTHSRPVSDFLQDLRHFPDVRSYVLRVDLKLVNH